LVKILVVEDDITVSKLVRDWLALENHKSEVVSDGAEAMEMLKVYSFDLIILDWELPNYSGIEILKSFRSRGGATPILLLTGKNSVIEKETGLDAGADDYLTKPFQGRELTARIRALLRRPEDHFVGIIQVGPLKLDRANHRVTRDEEEITLLPKEFSLLAFLMQNENRVFAPEALLNRVWDSDSQATSEALTSCIKRLRRKIDKDGQPSIIRTVHGVGYKLENPCDPTTLGDKYSAERHYVSKEDEEN
jgi:DNA-binding response OmpR family regulator